MRSMHFAERLKSLPSVIHLTSLDLIDAQGAVIASIHNLPGQAGSLAVYHALAQQHNGQITPAAAALGLQWYAEHTADAQTHPGKHPNIDRLIEWARGSSAYSVRLHSA